MRPLSPLPHPLRNRVFTYRLACHLGVPRHRLQASDVTSLQRGLYHHGPVAPSEAAVVAGLELLHPGLYASHQTSARIHRLLLPAALQKTAGLHVSRGQERPVLRLRGTVCHRVALLPGEVQAVLPPLDGPFEAAALRIATPARTWLDLAALLSLEDLVAVGDQLVRRPRAALEGRIDPWATPADLLRLLEAHPNLPGIRAAREALLHVRIGADSGPETKLRLALVAAGLPEPELQVRLDPTDRRSPEADLGYRRLRVAIQYEGSSHRTPDQLRRDNRRDAQFDKARWRYLKFDSADLFDGFARACREVREALRQAQKENPA